MASPFTSPGVGGSMVYSAPSSGVLATGALPVAAEGTAAKGAGGGCKRAQRALSRAKDRLHDAYEEQVGACRTAGDLLGFGVEAYIGLDISSLSACEDALVETASAQASVAVAKARVVKQCRTYLG